MCDPPGRKETLCQEIKCGLLDFSKMNIPVHFGWYMDKDVREFNVVSNDCHVNEFYYHDPGIVEKACYRNLEHVDPPKAGDPIIEFEYVGTIQD